jgi:hypothetical protein
VGESQTFAQRIGLTRGKAILVGVLAVALVAVLYWQYGGADGGEAIALAPVATDSKPAAAIPNLAMPVDQAVAEIPATTAPLATTAIFDQTKWKPPELATIVAYDPFALPATFPQPPSAASELLLAAEDDAEAAEDGAEAAQRLADAVEDLRMELAALQERGVNVILRGREGYVAMIGDRTVHVGDDIGGFTVTAIEPDGVRVERKIQ